MSFAQWNWENINKVGADFMTQAQSYSDGFPHDKNYCPLGPPPNTGDKRTSKILEITLRLGGDVHELIDLSVFEHGQRLQSAALTYKKIEGNVTDQVFKTAVGMSGGLIPPDGQIPGINPRSKPIGYMGDGTRKYQFMPSFPAPQPEEPTLQPVYQAFLPGNLTAMCRLVHDLNSYVTSRGNETFNALLTDVKDLIESDTESDDGYHSGPTGTWIGPAAYAFRNAWITCGAMMNGLHITFCEIAKIVGEGAQRLSSLEAALEQKLSAMLRLPVITGQLPGTPDLTWLQPAAYNSQTTIWFTVPGGTTQLIGLSKRGAQNVKNAPTRGIRAMLTSANEIYFEYAQQAETVRTQMATRLAGQAEILLDAVNYYNRTKSSGGVGGDQISVDSFDLAAGDATSMQNDLQAYLKGMKSSKGDLSGVASDISGVSTALNDANAILTDILAIKGMEGGEKPSSLKTGNAYLALAADALPVLATIGMAVLA